MDDELAIRVSAMLAPWRKQLGGDQVGYTNHVVRVLLLCDQLHKRSPDGGGAPSSRDEYLVAGVFHDLGIWNDHTFDYLVPSIDLAAVHLENAGRPELAPLVTRMIDLHHKQRPAGDADDPVEIFRRADTIDVTLGARRFGLPFSVVRAIRRDYPDRGFHRRLVQLTVRRTIEHPTSPLPMFKW